MSILKLPKERQMSEALEARYNKIASALNRPAHYRAVPVRSIFSGDSRQSLAAA